MRALLSTLITIALNVAYMVDVVRLRLGSAAFLVALPFLLANVATVAMLLASLRSKPIKVDQRWGIFAVALVASNTAALLHFTGIELVNPNLNVPVSLAAQLVTLALTPFYVIAVVTLGKQLTVVPEARKLVTRGPYSLSRHPLYVTYIIWHVLQIAVAQSLVMLAVSAVMALLLTLRAVGEEALLASAFPAEYAEYRKRVGWVGRWSPAFAPRAAE